MVISAAVAGIAAAGLVIFQLSRPGALYGLNEYDDGQYLGSAVLLLRGKLPFRDYALGHPPGISIVLSPLTLAFSQGSTRDLLAATRILTGFVAVLNVLLVAAILRHRGWLAVLTGSLALAVFPLAPLATKTILLEPYLVFFCLLGCKTLFHGDRVAGGRRLLLAGILFGFGASMKVWAAIPIAAALICCLPTWRPRWWRLLAGCALGFGIPMAPFFLAAPTDFLKQVVFFMLERDSAAGSLSIGERLTFITGVRSFPELAGGSGWAIFLLVALSVAVAAAFTLRRPGPLDWFLLISSTFTVIAMGLWQDMYMHYVYFSAAFLALLGGAAVGSIGQAGSEAQLLMPRVRRAVVPALTISVLTAGGIAVVRTVSMIHRYPGLITVGDQANNVMLLIPRGSCVISDEPVRLLSADRFLSGRPCPTLVDTYYEWVTAFPSQPPPSPPPYPPEFVARWQRWFSEADYAVLSKNSFRVPWTAELEKWFKENFSLLSDDGAFVYQRRW